MREKRLERQKAQFPELGLADSRSVFAVDRLRRERGEQPTSLGRAVEDTLIEDMSRGPTDAYAQSDTSEEAAPRGGYFGPSSSLNQGARTFETPSGYINTPYGPMPSSFQGTAAKPNAARGEPTRRSLLDDPRLRTVAGGLGQIAEQVDRPRGALFGAAEGAKGGLFSPGVGRGIIEGFKSPQDFTGGDLLTRAGVGDRDLIGSLSARDIAGGVADVLLDPADIALGGALGAQDLARGIGKGAKATTRPRQLAYADSFRIAPDEPLGRQVARAFDADPLFDEALRNTPNAGITERGIEIDLFRFQKPEQAGELSPRGAVFYLADEGSPGIKYYKHSAARGKTTAMDASYGGTQRVDERVVLERPFVVKGSTGGNAPKAAYDKLKGKGAYEAMRERVFEAIRPERGKRLQEWEIEERVSAVLEEFGADSDLAYTIATTSKSGNQLPYAIQEAIVASELRNAGYDSMVAWNTTKTRGARITEIMDLDVPAYPDPETTLKPRGGLKGVFQALNEPGELRPGEATQQARILPRIADKPTKVQQAPPIKGILDELLPTEQGSPRRVGSGLLRRYEGRLNAQGLEVKRDLDMGNQLLESVGIPKKTPRSPQMEGLFKALHGEGPVPAGMEDVYAEAKRLVDVETAATVDFNPSFTLHPDYFPRGWREVPIKEGLGVPGKGRFGATPGFAKPRSEASFSEILSTVYTKPDGTPYMLEPVSWNPMEMVALRRVAGAEFREQSELVRHLKDQGVALVADGPLPDGYRVPRVGPAFEGKPKVAPNDIPEQAPQFFGYTDRLAVPNKIADVLENIYGKRPSLGTVDTPFGEKDVLGLIRQTGNAAKRAKLIGSLFQQVDFTTRAGFATFGGAIDDVLSGKPISGAVKALSMPQEIGKLAWANTSAGRRAALRNQILSGDAIIPERPGISLKTIAEAGWRQQDISILPRTVRDTVQEITSSPPVDASPNLIKRATQKAAQFEKATQDGLFDGVYPQAQIIALKNFVVPRLVRQHPDWTDAQIAANAATEINKMFSTLGEYQTVLKNPGMRELMHNVFFSSNEAESAIRAAGSTVLGPNKRLWAEYGAGGMLFLGSVANLVHLAATGEPLPLDRYQPIERGGPVGIRYKGDFLSPNVPGLKGRNGTQVAVDLMGQMDTIFRVLDPAGFISARFNVIPRTVINQARGEDFYGRPLNTPLERVQQAASDLALPIGAGNVAGALNIGPENEGRLGTAGQLVQASGLNLRAETTPNLLERSAKEKYGVSYADLEPAQKLELQNGQTPLGTELKQRRDTAIERQDENSIRQQSVEDLRTRVRQVQEANDSAFQSGQITIDEWKARRKQTLAEQAGAFDQIYKGYEPKPADAGKPWELYRQKLSELEAQYGSLTSEAMDDLDQWRASLSEEQNAAIDRNSGLYSTPFEKEYRAVGRELDSRQYFDIGDEVWKAIAASDPTIGQYKSVDAFRTALSTEIVRTLSAQGIDPNSATAQLVMEDVLSQIPQLKVWSDVKNDVEQSWIEANPDIAGRAYTYGYIGSLRKDEKKAIMLSDAR